jgi:hypothetical protein
MTKSLKDILAGVKTSTVVPGSTGTQPGVDYAPKAPAEQDVVKKHKVEKHADRVGNGDDVYQAINIKHSQIKDAKHGYKKPEDQKVNEASSCNMTEEGTHCPVHEMASCGSSKKSLKEIITKKTSAGKVIKDFQKSDNEKFAGKSPEKRKQMALAAYYAKQRNEAVEQVDEATMSSGQKAAYRMGMAHGSKGTKKIDADKSFGPHADYYHRGYMQGKDSEDWHEKQRTRNESLAVPLIGSNGDDDESAEMAKTQLRALANKAMHLVMQLSDDQVVEPWVQAKIAVAKDNVSAVHDYMVFGNHDKPEAEQSAPYEGGIDMTGAPRNTYPNFSVDVNTGRNV